jgi:hypothetical protein
MKTLDAANIMIRDVILFIVLAAACYSLIDCSRDYKAPEMVKFNGADTLKIMIVNDSITSIKQYRK